MRRDCPAADGGVTCGRIGAHGAHAGLAEDGTLHTWSDEREEGPMPGPRHDVNPVPRMVDAERRKHGVRVESWRAFCETCQQWGPARHHRALAANDADRHRPHGDPFPSEGGTW